MSWLGLDRLLLEPQGKRAVAVGPAMNHATFVRRALGLAATLRARGVHRVALHLDDAAELAIALFGAWRAGVSVLLPADAQPGTRQHLETLADLWLDTLDGLDSAPLPPAELDLDACQLTLCTSGSSGAAKLIDKRLRQLAHEVDALEQLWGKDLLGATLVASVSAQHIYGLLFRVLWPLCAGRPFVRRALPFAEDLQQASLQAGCFAWVSSPALLKRMGENLDWPALTGVRRVFSSGGELPAEAAQALHRRLGQCPTEIYGSSETGGIAWRQGDVTWQAFAGVELGQDDDGALNVRSTYLPVGHCEQTADTVRLEGDGRFVLLGRLDRIVKLEEKRISLPMLEQALADHAWVAEVRLGVVNEGRAFLGALVALSPTGLRALRSQGRRSVTAALRSHLAGRCETIALPRRWRLLLHLPWNSQGKLPQAQVNELLKAPRPKRVPALSSVAGDDGEWLLELEVPPDLAHFSGHFAKTPVLPGVVQIDWALDFARQLLELPPRFLGMEVLKFQQLVRPGDRVQLSLRFDPQRSKLYFAYRNGEAACASGRILLGAADV